MPWKLMGRGRAREERGAGLGDIYGTLNEILPEPSDPRDLDLTERPTDMVCRVAVEDDEGR